MDISLFDYHLPQELIAQFPTENRDQSRLMILNRSNQSIEIATFSELSSYLKANDLLVVNNTKVFKARLIGHRISGAEVEIFLIRRAEANPFQWEALAKPSRRLNINEEILFSHDESLKLIENLGEGRWMVKFDSKESEKNIINNDGHVPLPQYIKRPDKPDDINRYQTIFARDEFEAAVAAPTAGFHFTEQITTELKQKNIDFAELTLHVGPGTFKPVTVDDITKHSVDPELAILTQATADKINSTKKNQGRLVAVGTTSCRTLESAEVVKGEIQPLKRMVDLYIQPGFRFKVVDMLVTNFHLPKSSLLILVSAFAGREFILKAYNQAINEGFRFYSYGDAMLIL